MYQHIKLSKLQNVQSKVFDSLEQFIKYYNTEVDKGQYLSFVNKVDDSITLKVGAERFTVHSQVNLKEDQVIFKIYAWVFDISKPDRYNHEHINNLDFYYDGDGRIKYYNLQLFKNKFGDEKQNDLLITFNQGGYEKGLEPFFDQLEKYTDNRLSPPSVVFI
jgi:hypothetical protein